MGGGKPSHKTFRESQHHSQMLSVRVGTFWGTCKGAESCTGASRAGTVCVQEGQRDPPDFPLGWLSRTSTSTWLPGLSPPGLCLWPGLPLLPSSRPLGHGYAGLPVFSLSSLAESQLTHGERLPPVALASSFPHCHSYAGPGSPFLVCPCLSLFSLPSTYTSCRI